MALELKNLYPEILIISNCILADTVVDKLQLYNSHVSIEESSLMQMNIHSITWPWNYKLMEERPLTEFKEKQISDKREIYRQLKVLSINANNKIDARFFMNSELRMYLGLLTVRLFPKINLSKSSKIFPVSLYALGLSFKVLFISIAKLVNPQKLFTRKALDEYHSFQDFLILYTNAIFSNFGQSLIRPIMWLILFHTIFFWALINNYPAIGIETSFLNPQHHEWGTFWKGFSLYVNLLSPVHGTEIPNQFSTNSPPTSIFGTLDFFMRLSAGYFIYYFIKATRKFNFSV